MEESEEIKQLEQQLESDTQKMENDIRTKENEMMSELDDAIHNLIERGSKIEQSENKEFLIQEYNLMKDYISNPNPNSNVLYRELTEELLHNRDNFISNQINTTLNDGEIGIAFFGGIHSIVDKLNDDIVVDIVKMFKDEISLKLIK